MTGKPKTPTNRTKAAAARRRAFAHAFCRLGQASAAFREITPSARLWKAESVATQASRLMRDPLVRLEITRLQEDARLDAIASRQEIARTLADIMRGTLTETRTVNGAALQFPPPISQRIRAARELERMLPSVEPKAPEAAAAKDDAASTLDDRLAAFRKRRSAP